MVLPINVLTKICIDIFDFVDGLCCIMKSDVIEVHRENFVVVALITKVEEKICCCVICSLLSVDKGGSGREKRGGYDGMSCNSKDDF
jgi:hypothetical protein